MALVKGRVSELKAIESKFGVKTYNFGNSRGYSVLELIHAFEEVSGVEVLYVSEERRLSDVADSYSDPTKTNKELG